MKLFAVLCARICKAESLVPPGATESQL